MVKKLTKKQAEAMYAKQPKKDIVSIIVGKLLVWSFSLCLIGLFAAGIKFAWTYLF